MKTLVMALLLGSCSLVGSEPQRVEVTVNEVPGELPSPREEQELIDNWIKAASAAQTLEEQLQERNIFCHLGYDGRARCSRIDDVDVNAKPKE